MRTAGWSGIMALPRVMRLDGDGMLQLTLLPELNVLRRDERAGLGTGAGLEQVLHRATGEMLCAGARDGSYRLTLHAGSDELLQASYSAETHALLLDGKEVPLAPGDAPTLHAFVDGSVLEVIAAGRIGYTKRFYYAGPVAPDVTIAVTAPGAAKLPTLRAWSVAPISGNRLTTPAADERSL